MSANSISAIEMIIRDYIEQKEKYLLYGKKKIDSEKEYNKLLTKYNGEAKNYSLEQADMIYKAYLDMIAFDNESSVAQSRFTEAENKLLELGNILFEASITAEITIPPLNGEPAPKRLVTVEYINGQVHVN